MATFNFQSLKFNKKDIQEIFEKYPSFNRICFQLYTSNGTDFSLVAQLLKKGREKIGPPVIFINSDGGTSASSSRDIMFGQYELSKSSLKKLCKDFSTDIVLKPVISPINPESVGFDVNNGETTLNPCPPAIPPGEE